MLKLSDEGVALIKTSEAFRGKMYPCPAGHCTIGYGHLIHPGPIVTGTKPKANDPKARRLREEYLALEAPFLRGLTEGEADLLLRQDLVHYEEAVRRLVKVPLDQSEYDALVDFVYNAGVGAFQTSTLLRKLNAKDYDGAAAEFDRWVHANGQRLAGLVRRRDTEEALFRRDLPREPVINA